MAPTLPSSVVREPALCFDIDCDLGLEFYGEVFDDPVIANAIIDRLIHHCEVIKINGISYRIKDKSIFEEES